MQKTVSEMGKPPHRRADKKALRKYTEAVLRLSPRRVRELVTGELLKRGYAAHWSRDLITARILFRHVMRRGYGRPKNWVYMLPSLFPLPLHAGMLHRRDDVKP